MREGMEPRRVAMGPREAPAIARCARDRALHAQDDDRPSGEPCPAAAARDGGRAEQAERDESADRCRQVPPA